MWVKTQTNHKTNIPLWGHCCCWIAFGVRSAQWVMKWSTEWVPGAAGFLFGLFCTSCYLGISSAIVWMNLAANLVFEVHTSLNVFICHIYFTNRARWVNLDPENASHKTKRPAHAVSNNVKCLLTLNVVEHNPWIFRINVYLAKSPLFD